MKLYFNTRSAARSFVRANRGKVVKVDAPFNGKLKWAVVL